MDNPHPLWECWGCQRRWQWPVTPAHCGFCSCTHVMAVNPRTKVVVVSIEHVKEGRRSIIRDEGGKIIGPLRRAQSPSGRAVMRCSICHQPHHTRLYHKSPAIAVLVPNGVAT